MEDISDEEMRETLLLARGYCAVLLKAGPAYQGPEAKSLIYAHGKRNMSLRKAGILPIVCPCTEPGELRGIGIFNLSPEETKKTMDEDPGVRAGVFTYEIFPVCGFPGSSLPDASAPSSTQPR